MLRIEMKRWIKHLKGQLRRLIIASIAAGLLTVHGVLAVPPTQVNAEPADVSVRNWYPSSVFEVPEVKPSWTVKVDNYLDMDDENYLGRQAIAEDGKVFAFTGKKLIAIDASTGKRLWSYGKDLKPYVVFHNGVIYGLSGDQMPYALNAKTGKLKWQSNTSIYMDTRLRTEVLVPTVDTLYAIKGSSTFAFDAATGKLRWKTNEPSGEGHGTDYLQEADGVILRTFYIQGALTSLQLTAYDKKTGKKLWDHFGQGEALQIKNGLVYSVDYYSPLLTDYQSLPDRKVIVNVYNLKTGVKKSSRDYSWKMSGEPPYEYGGGGLFINQGKLYMDQGNKVAEYNFDTYKKGEVPLRTFPRPYGGDWELIGLVQERLIFKDIMTRELAGIKLANGEQIDWRGDAPVAQIDVYGKGLYRAQRNGTLLGINMLTTLPVFRVTTGADLHESTLKTNGMIIIQAEDKLLGVKVPASLK
ncbi:PQQ-binding-like beta-propeller repeat protein [Paenibacillus sp. FSL W8-0187]|uniref:outer membrane protein assembly factor BamB family protein n=1 Tax=unclassified Paenibacillus TaxID=185978 RepID=UPI0030DD61A3